MLVSQTCFVNPTVTRRTSKRQAASDKPLASYSSLFLVFRVLNMRLSEQNATGDCGLVFLATPKSLGINFSRQDFEKALMPLRPKLPGDAVSVSARLYRDVAPQQGQPLRSLYVVNGLGSGKSPPVFAVVGDSVVQADRDFEGILVRLRGMALKQICRIEVTLHLEALVGIPEIELSHPYSPSGIPIRDW
jgi:hypothetical protein